MSRRVVVTGLGTISALGLNTQENWDNMKKGVCGIHEITGFDHTKTKVSLAAEVDQFDANALIGRKEAKKMDRYTQFAVVCAREAYQDAQLEGQVDPNRFGVILSSGIGGIGTIESEVAKALTKGYDRISPFFIPMVISNLAAGHVAIDLRAKGMVTCVVTACAGGTNAIGDAFRQIRDGYQDVMIAGGSEAAITPMAIGGFASMKALHEGTDPNRASIPFDKERSGFVMGEGAGLLVLEEYEHAKARGAHIYAEMVGYGATCDAYHITAPAPEGEGGARCMKQALDDAKIAPEAIDYINAHGTSTPMNDKFETMAIKTTFGEHAYHLAVSSTKAMTGHMLGATGGVEAVACVKALEEGVIPATINYREADPECDLDIVPNEARHQEIEYALSNSLGFGGHNAAIIFKKYKGA